MATSPSSLRRSGRVDLKVWSAFEQSQVSDV
jgi:hypothetical protein